MYISPISLALFIISFSSPLLSFLSLSFSSLCLSPFFVSPISLSLSRALSLSLSLYLTNLYVFPSLPTSAFLLLLVYSRGYMVTMLPLYLSIYPFPLSFFLYLSLFLNCSSSLLHPERRYGGHPLPPPPPAYYPHLHSLFLPPTPYPKGDMVAILWVSKMTALT